MRGLLVPKCSRKIGGFGALEATSAYLKALEPGCFSARRRPLREPHEKKSEQIRTLRTIQIGGELARRLMLDSPPETNALLNPPAQAGTADAPSVIEDRMVRLFDENRVPLLRYLSAFPLPLPDAEDVVQEVFLSLFQQLRRGKSHHNVRGWLFRAAHNLAVKKNTRSRNDLEKIGSLAPVEETAIDPSLNPEDEFASNQKQKRLISVVRALPEQHRLCLYLRAEGLRYREIAEVLDMSLGAVSIALGRSLAHLSRAAER